MRSLQVGYLSLTLSHTLTHTHTHTHTQTQTHTHTHTIHTVPHTTEAHPPGTPVQTYICAHKYFLYVFVSHTHARTHTHIHTQEASYLTRRAAETVDIPTNSKPEEVGPLSDFLVSILKQQADGMLFQGVQHHQSVFIVRT